MSPARFRCATQLEQACMVAGLMKRARERLSILAGRVWGCLVWVWMGANLSMTRTLDNGKMTHDRLPGLSTLVVTWRKQRQSGHNLVGGGGLSLFVIAQKGDTT